MPHSAQKKKGTKRKTASTPETKSPPKKTPKKVDNDKGIVDSDIDESKSDDDYVGSDAIVTPSDKPAGSTYRNLVASLQDKQASTITLRSYVALNFFPMVTFIVNKEELAYYSQEDNPTSYCVRITKGCGIVSGVEAVKWWEDFAKREVMKKINQLRSNRLTTLKWVFIGKLFTVQFIC